MRSLSEISGPIMVGPSSSHTAGACRIGKISRIIANDEICEVIFYLHGSFGKTYKGNGTDRALVGGILGMDTDDERIINSMEIAKKHGIKFSFVEVDLGSLYHPNTVKLDITTKSSKKISIIASSVGGGNIEIVSINGKQVYFTGQYNTLLINHIDKPGIVHKVSGVLSSNDINIAYLKVFRDRKGYKASMVFELDQIMDDKMINEVKSIQDIKECVFIEAMR
mgnify:FL=1